MPISNEDRVWLDELLKDLLKRLGVFRSSNVPQITPLPEIKIKTEEPSNQRPNLRPLEDLPSNMALTNKNPMEDFLKTFNAFYKLFNPNKGNSQGGGGIESNGGL